MATMRRAARRDQHEADIVQVLRSVGASVTRINEAGAPDLLVGFRGVTYCLECKTPKRKDGKGQSNASKGGRGELTAAQVEWWRSWRGGPAVVVRSMTDALQAVGAMV